MNRKMLGNIAIGLLAALVLLAAFRIVMKIIQSGRKGEQLVFSVGSMVLKKQAVDVLVSFEGIIQGDPQVKVYPQVSGKFQGNAVEEGTYVQQGNVLAYINRDIVGADYLYSPVKSPIAGMVTKLYFIDKGAMITPNSAVAEVADIRNIKVVINAGQNDLVQIKKGQKTLIYPAGDISNGLTGSVYSVTPFVDSDTLSGGIVVKAENRDNRMKVGMSANVDIAIGRRDMFLVPESSIIMGLDKVFVFVNSNGKARQVEIVRGYTKEEMVEISGDLNEGDLLITDGNFRLNNGVPIRMISTNGLNLKPADVQTNQNVVPTNSTVQPLKTPPVVTSSTNQDKNAVRPVTNAVQKKPAVVK